jgi:hypothetical protein
MKYSSLLSATLCVAACSQAPESRETAIMNEIERAVVLPRDAKPLEKYGRNYAPAGGGKILATYLIPFPPLEKSTGCAVMENWASRPCTKKEIEETLASDAQTVEAQTPAGKRRWFRDSRSLPFIDDGGCMQVSVEYDATTHRILTVACNGEA